MRECGDGEMDKTLEGSLSIRVISVEIKFLSLRLNFLCSFKVGGCVQYK